MIDLKYANAFSEVLDIIFNLSEEEYKKIPKEFLQFIEESSNQDYEFVYDSSRTLDEQNVLPETKTIIAIICRDFLVDKEEKEKIIQKDKKEIEKYEIELREKYNPDNIFKNRNENIQKEITEEAQIQSNNNNQLAMVEYKQSFFTKLIQKFKNFFHIKK